jgi:hypothetical protein
MKTFEISISFRNKTIPATVEQHIDYYLVQFEDPEIVNEFGEELMFDVNRKLVPAGMPKSDELHVLCSAIEDELPVL